VNQVQDRCARSRSFLGARFRRTTPFGLALTAQFALVVLLLAFLSLVTEDIVEGEELEVDSPVERFLIGRRTAGLTTLMRILTSLGSAQVVVPLLLAVGLLARWALGSWRPLGFLAITVGGATLTSTVIKLVVARPRPTSGALVDALGYAFPSGHSTTGTAAWLAAAVVLASMTRAALVRVLLGTVAIVVVVLIGVSRVYLGVHAPTDVLGGWAIGTLWLTGVLIAARLLSDRRNVSGRRRGGRPRPPAASGPAW
jgi:membrane-associated phospholipid phosphatase